MRVYTIKKIEGVPDWNTVPIMPIDNLLWTDSTDVSAQAQVCYDAENLYLREEAVEPHIRMEETGALAEVYNDSCLEFFLRPTERMDYLNFEVNPNCALWLGFGTNVDNLIRLLPEEKDLFDFKVEFTAGGWVLTYRIPFSFIRRFFPEFEAKAGTKMYANAHKCGDMTEKCHFLAWNPVVSEEPLFHCPQDFGIVILGG